MKKLIMLLILISVNTTAWAQKHAIILQYHHINENTPPLTSTKPDLFRWQMAYLKEHNYHVLPLSEVVSLLKQQQELPEKTLAITFDDAYSSIYETALPILKENNFPFSIFVNTDLISSSTSQLNWKQLKILSQENGEILNHSTSHSHLNRLKHGESLFQWKERITIEISKAQSTIQHFIGDTPKILAYPYGEYSIELVQLIREMGYSGVGQQSGPAGFDMPIEILPRFPMGGQYATKQKFIEKLHTLPMPLAEHIIIDPLTTSSEQPIIILSLDKTAKLPIRYFTCYVSGQGTARIKWDKEQMQVMVQAKEPFNPGRNRYNCTMPARNKLDNKKYYYWLSQLWITPKTNGSWYQE